MAEFPALRVAQKELRLFLNSSVGWSFLGAFSAASLFVFFWVEAFFARNIADVRPLFEWMPVMLIFLAAALTMRLWSEERSHGTLEYLLTRPVPLWQFVLGKFLACATLLVLALLATLPLPLTVATIANLDWGPVLAGYLAAALLGCAYLSIGLFVSAHSANAMLSLMGSVLVCGALYLIGSPLLTGFFNDDTATLLRLLGSGSRFDSITRGVIDLRDLYYYAALCAGFLALNVYTLDRQRWATDARQRRHRLWHTGIALLLLNLLLAGTWLQQLSALRLDVTEGRMYSISEPTRDLLDQTREPLLIRGYFSERTHPLLAPLVPQIKDLLKEYAVAGGNRVQVEFVDPADRPETEQEANEKYGINATPFQVADRYQSALVNAFFNVLVAYGGEHETLGFADLIEVKTASGTQPEVALRNPEFDITRAIRDVLHSYQAGGNLFEQIDRPVQLTAYVSADDKLPQLLLTYRKAIQETLEARVARAGGRFRVEFIEPEAGDGAVAQRIVDEWGFQPMLTSLDNPQEFYFYLTLEDDHQVVQLPTGAFDPGAFEQTLDAGLKRFASGFTKTIALVLPGMGSGQFRGMAPAGHTFQTLEQEISRDYSIVREDLTDGEVDSSADLLLVLAPENLDDTEVYALDQFLMRGGTVVLGSSAFSVEARGGDLQMRDVDSGLTDWLLHHGVDIAPAMVLDSQHRSYPVPVMRRVGGYEFRDMQFVDYPYFIDVRGDGLNSEHPITGGLPSLALAWGSPVSTTRDDNQTSAEWLLRSSPDAWRSSSRNVMPGATEGSTRSDSDRKPSRETLGVLLQGRFSSAFSRAPGDNLGDSAGVEERAAALGREQIRSHLGQSSDSARLIVIGSNDFASDQVMSGLVAASGTQFLSPVELLMNTLDWSLTDGSLLQIRSRAHFNRTLPPLDSPARSRLEYANYAAALLVLALFGLLHWLRERRRRAYWRRVLA
ncbi:MAG: Gldg family protein [Chromatocurvus sp.]